MFDRLVESEPKGAARSRRNYFVASTLAMSVISLTALVISIFADDYSLNTSLELSEIIAPVEMAQVAPEQPQPRQPMTRTQQTSSIQETTRTDSVRNIAEISDVVPPISTAPSNAIQRPIGIPFKIGSVNTDPGDGSGRGTPDGNGIAQNGISAPTADIQSPAMEIAPPRVAPPKIPPVVSLGVINGKATYLPKPAYPPAAQAVAASGSVEVQVLIDEEGRVVSAHAANGNPLLRAAAEHAAMGAKFTPTKLSNVPVKVTGVITYNFMRS